MATTAVLRTLEKKPRSAKEYKGTSIPFNLGDPAHPKNLQQRLKSLQENKLNNLEVKAGELTAHDFENIMTSLNGVDQSELTAEEKLTIEEYRTALMVSVRAHLLKKPLNEAPPSPPRKASAMDWTLFIILMVFEFAPALIGGMMYASKSLNSMLPYIPFVVPSSVLTSLGVACVINQNIGMISFVGPSLLEKMGIPYDKKWKPLPEALRLQLDATQQINTKLIEDQASYKPEQYNMYSMIAKLFNTRMDGLKKNCPQMEESIFSQIATAVMSTLTVLTAVTGALFMSAIFVRAIVGSPAKMKLVDFIASMPITVGILAIVVTVPTVAINYYLRLNSAIHVFNPGDEQVKVVQSDLEKFQNKNSKYDEINNINFRKVLESSAEKTRGRDVLQPLAQKGNIVNLLNKPGERKIDSGNLEDQQSKRVVRRYSI